MLISATLGSRPESSLSIWAFLSVLLSVCVCFIFIFGCVTIERGKKMFDGLMKQMSVLKARLADVGKR